MTSAVRPRVSRKVLWISTPPEVMDEDGIVVW
jgi:hypothetical protein